MADFQVLHRRRDDIAESWLQAIQQAGVASLEAVVTRGRLIELTDQVITLLLVEPFDRNQAESVGARLARLTSVQPEVLGGTLETLACQLVQDMSANHVGALQPRLAALLGGLATGFSRQAHENMVAEREQVERPMDESEERYRELVEGLPDGVSVTDLSGRILMSSRQDAILHGYDSVEEMIGKDAFDLIAPEDRQRAMENSRKIAETGTGGTREYTMLRKDGSRFAAEVSTSVIMGADGMPRFIVGVGRDITDRKQAEELLMRRAQEMTALYQTSLEVNSQFDISMLLQAIVRRAVELLGAYAAGLYLMRSDGQAVELVDGYRMPKDRIGLTLRLGEGLAGRVAQSGKFLTVDDYRNWDGRAAAFDDTPFRRILGVPLKVGDRVIGVINIADDRRTDSFGQDSVQLVSMFAAQAALAIENVRLYRAEQEQRELAEALRDTAAALNSTLSFDQVLDRILSNIGRIVSHDSAAIMLYDTEDRMAYVVRHRGYAERGLETWVQAKRFPVAEMPGLRQMLATKQALVVQDTQSYPDWAIFPETNLWWRSYVGAPIRVKEEVIGFLNLNSVTLGAFTATDAGRLEALADQAAVAIQNARLYEEAQEATRRLQAMSHRLVEAQESERRNIARELHDQIGQIITGFKLRLEMSNRLPDSALRDNLSEAQTLAQELLERVRQLSLDLRPTMLDDLGLPPALLWLFGHFTDQTSVPVAFKHAGVEQRRFPAMIETAAYRIVQEALTNVARHAGARAVTVRLWATSETLNVQVEDDGVGFDPEAASAPGVSTGLSSMRERAMLLGGHLEVESSVGTGARVTAELPLNDSVQEP